MNEKQGVYEEAIVDFKKVIDLDPTFINAVYGKANCENLLGKFDDAIETYNMAFTKDNDHKEIEEFLPPRMSAIRR